MKNKEVATNIDPIVEYVAKEFQRYEAHWSDKFKQAEKYYDHWAGKPPAKDYDWENAVHVPMMLEAEQTITPRIYSALFPNEAPIDVATGGGARPDQAIKIKGLIAHHFRVSDVQYEASPAMTQNTLFGTCYMDTGSWFVKRGWLADQDGNRNYQMIESRPNCKWVDFFQLFPHPNKLEIDDGLPLCRRQFVDSETIKSLFENPYFENQKLQEALSSKFSNDTLKKDSPNHYMPEEGEQYEMITYWGPWDEDYKDKDGRTKTRKAVPYWIIVINRKVAIRAIPNPYDHQSAPIVKGILYPDAKPSWFGVGIGQIGRPTQERLNKMVNQRLNNVDLVLNRQGFYNGNDPLLNPKNLQVSKPGKWHKVSDINGSIRWMDTPDVTASSYQEESLAKNDFRQATGATDTLSPAPSGEQHRTAMGISMLQGAAGMRFRPVLRRLERDIVQQTAFFYFSNLKQFMTEDEWVMVTSDNGETQPVLVTREEIQAKVFFIPTGISETLQKEQQIGQLLRFKEITMNDPTVNRQEINRRIAEMLGFKDIHKLLVPQQQPAQVQGGFITPEIGQSIRQRIAEGANPEQIKQEFLGNRPQAPQQAEEEMPQDMPQEMMQ